MPKVLVPYAAADISSLATSLKTALHQRHEAGRLVRLPNKFSVQRMEMWVMWTRFAPPRRRSAGFPARVARALSHLIRSPTP